METGQGMADSRGATGAKNGKAAPGRSPVTDKIRARVIELGRTGEWSRNAIAKDVGLSGATVSKICREAQPPVTFDRSAIRAATEAKVFDAKARRARLAEGVLDDADEIRKRLFAQLTVKTTDGNGMVVEYQVDPSARDWKDAATALGIMIDKHLVLARADSDDRDLPAVDAWLVAMMGGTS